MSIMERVELDMGGLLLQAYDLGDMINASDEMSRYLYWKSRYASDPEAAALIAQLNRKKDLFEEAQRFGHFHPNYHEALDAVKEVEQQLEQIEAVREFKHAEANLDDLLYTVSKTIAHAVSESVKVPSNNPLPEEGGCASGGSCSGNCG